MYLAADNTSGEYGVVALEVFRNKIHGSLAKIP